MRNAERKNDTISFKIIDFHSFSVDFDEIRVEINDFIIFYQNQTKTYKTNNFLTNFYENHVVGTIYFNVFDLISLLFIWFSMYFSVFGQTSYDSLKKTMGNMQNRMISYEVIEIVCDSYFFVATSLFLLEDRIIYIPGTFFRFRKQK